MKTVTTTDFRKQASTFLSEVEKGEMLIVLRHGKPIAEVIPYTNAEKQIPSWKRPVQPLEIKGSDLSSAIIEERESET